ncbi:hypothetical protein LJC20_02830, partial [Eubacteriales bacterium OttesenSCG-928-M02]|nr:hypothetical protein [Eubacteriales bacterium OttesenSCG-928-M02]
PTEIVPEELGDVLPVDASSEKEDQQTNPAEKKRKPKGLAILAIAAVAILAIGLSAFGVSHWMNLNNATPAMGDTPITMPTVQFAAYRQAEGIPLKLTASSVEKDMNIAILDGEDEQPITNVAFAVMATDPSGEVTELVDDDADGKIYAKDLEPGEYTLALKETGRFIVPEPVAVKVKEKVERVVIPEIKDKIVNAKNVNAAAEDGGHSRPATPAPAPTPSANDTIPYYESKTITTQKEVTEPLLENGQQVVKYKPVLNEEGFLLLAGGEASEVKPELDGEGYCQPTDEKVFVDGKAQTDVYKLTAVPQFTTKMVPVTIYQGWHTQNGKRYYYDLEGKPVTGAQVIQGASYVFDANGVLQQKVIGIDVSSFQSAINWTKARNEGGLHFVMVRAGYRGYGSGVLVEDRMFKTHIEGAYKAGAKVGVYYYSQAINEVEAVEEASAAVALAKKYNVKVTYPIAIDLEYATSNRSGRADKLTAEERTKVAEAFCETVRSAGYTPMIYASKSWFSSNTYMIPSRLTKYKVWLAQWGVQQPTYTGRIDMWQYTSDGSMPGYSGRLDVNISYLGH